MSRRKKTSTIVIALVVVALLMMGVKARSDDAVLVTDVRPDTPPYGVRGPHPSGTRDLATGGAEPLAMTIWYPAATAGPAGVMTYPYQIKLGGLLGDVTIARVAGQAVEEAPYDLAAGPYPLVLFSAGFATGGPSYAWLAEHLASHGLVVIAPDHPEQFDPELAGFWQAAVTRPQELLAVLAYVDQQAAPGGALAGLVDAQRVAVAGHSLGGYSALAVAGGRLDLAAFGDRCEVARAENDPNAWLCNLVLPHAAAMAELAGLDVVPEGLWPAWSDPRIQERIDAVISLAGDAFLLDAAGLAGISAPVLAIGGTLDGDAPYEWSSQLTYDHVAGPTRVAVALQDAEHMIFTGTCQETWRFAEPLLKEFCADESWDRNQAHDLVNHFAAAFLLAELKGDPAAAAALAPAAADFPGISYAAEGYYE